ncbi:cupredoxin domain-containing protein [Sinomonas sp. P47F7]|uniref:cupredoxin domain-containing protein n=1 Tax=Sinomonas sp. P47F7 TaxID=3410987 RepID=UPI003BF6191C
MNRTHSPRRALAALALAGAAALGAAGCSGPTTGTPSGASSSPATTGASMDPGMAMGAPTAVGSVAAATVHIKAFAYSDPGPVAPGASVTVMNMDSEAHTLTANDGSFTVTAAPGQTVTFTAPAKPGTYAYHCQYHSNMHGTLTVK